jgi:hypothetical protein
MTVVDFRTQSLIRRAPTAPLDLCADDRAYIDGYLAVVGEALGREARPRVPLTVLPARAFVAHLAELRATLNPHDFDQRLALGRLESVLRLVETAITVMEHRRRRA